MQLPFCTRIRAARLANGMTAEELGKALHISQSTVTRYENGIKTPGTRMLLEIADTLEIDVIWMLSGRGLPTYTAKRNDVIQYFLDDLTAGNRHYRGNRMRTE